MLLYLPERIYKHLENDEIYASMIKETTNKIFSNDYLKTMHAYENDNEEIAKLQNYIKNNTPEEFQMELNLSFSDDLSKYEKDFDNMDIETKLYWLCEMEAGNMVLTKEFNLRNMKFLRLYKNNVIPEKEKYSEFLHCMYYFKLMYEKIIEMTEKEKTYNLVLEYFKYESEIFNEIIEYSSLEAFKQMMFSKREQMYVLFYEFIGQFCSEYKEVNQFIRKCLINYDFKYNEFSYFKLMFNNLIFQQCIDKFDIKSAKQNLDTIIQMINYAYDNKSNAIKSLNHYNNSFIDEFLNYSHFIYNMVKVYMPNLNKSWNFINNVNLTDLEKRFYKNSLTTDENKIYIKYIKKDNNYSKNWVEISKNLLSYLDELYS